MKKFLFSLLALLLVAFAVAPAHAEGVITVSDQDLSFNFPTSMTFTASAASDAEIEKMTLVIRFPTVTRRVEADITPGKEVDARRRVESRHRKLVVRWRLYSARGFGNVQLVD